MQLSPLDCTGCGNCADVCPGKKGEKALVMKDAETQAAEEANWEYAMKLPDFDLPVNRNTVKGSQFLQPAVRVLRRVRRLRRNPVCQAAHPAVRRSYDHRQRDGLLLHLRRFFPDLPVLQER